MKEFICEKLGRQRRLISSAAVLLFALNATLVNANQPATFIDIDNDTIDDRVEVRYGLSPTSNDSDGDSILDAYEFNALIVDEALMVDPTIDTDNEGINDILEIYGYYLDGTTIRGLKRLVSNVKWDEFKSRDNVGGYAVYQWAAEAIEESGYIANDCPETIPNCTDSEAIQKILDITNPYLHTAIVNKFIENGLPPTHQFINGSPTENGTIASIISEFLSNYGYQQPKIGTQILPVYYTDPVLRSSDYDQYSDKDEVTGNFGDTGAPQSPADDPLIGAMPEISTALTDFVITDIKELRDSEGTTAAHADVTRVTKTRAREYGVSVELSTSSTITAGPKPTASVEFGRSLGTSLSWTNSTAISTAVSDSFGVTNQFSEGYRPNCFAKLQLNLNMSNLGSDTASSVLPKWYIFFGNTLWKTLNSNDYLGNGVTFGIGGDDHPVTVLGQGAGDEGCLTIDQTNYLNNGGAIRIVTEFDDAQIAYLNENTGIIETGGQWGVYRVNYEQNMAKIVLNVFTTNNVEINKTIWVRAYDADQQLPQMKVSIKQALEKAYTPVNCADIDSTKVLCLETEQDGYILLDDESIFDFRFFDSNMDPLSYDAWLAAYNAVKPDSGNKLDTVLPRYSAITILDDAARTPVFSDTTVITRSANSTGSGSIEVRALVNDYFGINTVDFCKTETDCIEMLPAIDGQPSNVTSGYYRVYVDDYDLQGTEYLKATNVKGGSTQQSPSTFFINMIGTLHDVVDETDNWLLENATYLNSIAALNEANPTLYTEITDEMVNLVVAEQDFLYLKNLFEQVKAECSFINPVVLDDTSSLLAQWQNCFTAITNYQHAAAETNLGLFNPVKVPLKSELIAQDLGVSRGIGSGIPDANMRCHLDDFDFITGLELSYKFNASGGNNEGAKVHYRTPVRTGLVSPLYTWGAVNVKFCGTNDGGKQWMTTYDTIDSTPINGTIANSSINVLSDFGWSVQGANVNRLCAVSRKFNLYTAQFENDYDEHCVNAGSSFGLESYSDFVTYVPGGSLGPQLRSVNDFWLEASYNHADKTYARYYTYKYDYQPKPDHSLKDGNEYYIKNVAGEALTLQGSQLAARTIGLTNATGEVNQVWIVEAVNDREFRIKPKTYDGYLSRPNIAGDVGNIVSVYATAGDDDTTVNYNQHWRIEHTGTNRYNISSVVTGTYLSVTDLKLSNSQPSWYFEPVVNESQIVGRAQGIEENYVDVSLGQTFASSPVVFADIQSANDMDTAGLRVKQVSSKEFRIKVEEEQSADDEVDHAKETIGFLATEKGGIYDINGTIIGEAGSIMRNANPQDGPDNDGIIGTTLHRTYESPVVLMFLNSDNGGDPAHVRIQSYDSANKRLHFKIEEWGVSDGSHVRETIAYMVIEAGDYRLANGQRLEAKLINNVTDDWTDGLFDSQFLNPPIVLSQSQTINGGDAIVSRLNSITETGFEVRLQEQESLGDHTEETVGIIAVGR